MKFVYQNKESEKEREEEKGVKLTQIERQIHDEIETGQEEKKV